jgi:glutaminase
MSSEIGAESRRASRRWLRAALFALLVLAGAAMAATAGQSGGNADKAVKAALNKYKGLNEGKNADYIPVLAKVDPNLFGIVVVTVDGKVHSAGDISTEVSIQSISKVFVMARVIQDSGEAAVRDGVGVDATGQEFNSITAVEQHKGKEMNPMVNPGAITMTSMIKGGNADQVWNNVLGTLSDFAGRTLTVNDEVYKSESETNQRNQAIAQLMKAYELLQGDPQQATDLYTRQCAVNVNAKDLAIMAATHANGGRNPVTRKQVLGPEHIAPVLAVMATAGLYDDSGKWLFATGLPAKSGVGGGIIAVSPGKFGIGVISPPLDKAGNSVRAQNAIRDISTELAGNPYLSRPR